MSAGDSGATAVTACGAVTAFGVGVDRLWEGVAAGVDGIREVERFDTAPFRSKLAATVPGGRRAGDCGALCLEFAREAALEAWSGARLDRQSGRRAALVLGTSIASHQRAMHSYAEQLGDIVGIRGPRVTISTACSSSTNALGLARDLLQAGEADVVLAGGADALNADTFAGFDALGVLAEGKCAPFSEVIGTSLGEGAGFVVLEPESRARARAVQPLAYLLGYGLSADAYHETGPDPSGAGVARALRGVLHDAALDPAAVGYVNMHGTGTAANDVAEWRGVLAALGDRARELPVSATKSIIGHAQGAAGVLEAIVTILAMQHGVLPQTLRCGRLRPRSPADPVAQPRPRPASYEVALCCNSAFGGANAAVALRRAPKRQAAGKRASQAAPRKQHNENRRRRLRVRGVGVVAGHGVRLADLADALHAGLQLPRRVPAVSFDRLVRHVDVRQLDPCSRFIVTAASLALTDGDVWPRGETRCRSGLIAGLSRLSPQSSRAFGASIERGGLARVSANAFARMVLNAPTGSATTGLSLRGPTSTLTTGSGSGLTALVYAAEMLSRRDDVDLLLAAAADERDGDASADQSEGACCLALTPCGVLADDDPVVSGWALTGPAEAEAAAGRAIARAGLSLCELGAIVGSEPPFSPRLGVGRVIDTAGFFGVAEATGSLWSCAAAVVLLRDGALSSALVLDCSASASTAVVLTAPKEEGEPG